MTKIVAGLTPAAIGDLDGISARVPFGAAHDAVYLARVAPTAMIFVPCEGGISHNELESARPDELAAGCNVLLRAVVERAGAR